MTRGVIKIFKDMKPFICLSINSDMYPTGVVRDVALTYQDYKEVDGIRPSDKNIYNGIGDFAAQLITYLKNDNKDRQSGVDAAWTKAGLPAIDLNQEAGWLYIEEPNYEPEDVEYIYEITSLNDELFMYCKDREKTLFKGTLKEYLTWLEERGEE